MASKKMCVEVVDEDGNRYTIILEGVVTREKALHVLDIVELLGGVRDDLGESCKENSVSKVARTRALIQKRFPFTWFSSREIQDSFEREYREPIPLSTVSTYLSRMTSHGLLIRRGSSNNRRYRTIPKPRLEAFTTAKEKT
jgi:hypothetical protein